MVFRLSKVGGRFFFTVANGSQKHSLTSATRHLCAFLASAHFEEQFSDSDVTSILLKKGTGIIVLQKYFVGTELSYQLNVLHAFISPATKQSS